MRKKFQMLAALICYILGVVGAFYVGGWLMLVQPLQTLYISFVNRTLTLPLILVCGIKILLSATMAGLVWCIGYIGCNHFKGTEDPDWEALEQKHSLQK